MKAISKYTWFRRVAMAEGISFLVLLGIAMPLKYFADSPMAVKITGYIHGFLFMAFVVFAIEVKSRYSRSFGWLALAMLASFLPFGTFLMDGRWKKEERQLREAAARS